ncbi:hypothetical protein HQN89_32470 [Paenibacillus frigoriresistens]|uniref:hypothetical protein n=1 Tax=Paenibacillus alginolyticus TaxID=59839 RepID=UPI001563324D|nr:hypothetical protein [Paenibacillus frigoriresistens]NRF95555.1 hypothetical protein [Paenibacillus frigoriresistens]
MSKKLELNGLWESSRMMLPQHKESAIKGQKEKQLIQRQALDIVLQDVKTVILI